MMAFSKIRADEESGVSGEGPRGDVEQAGDAGKG